MGRNKSSGKKRNGKRKGEEIPKKSEEEIVKNSPYTLEYWLNGVRKPQPIDETDFYNANERALEILKNVKGLKLKKDANIKLKDNKKDREYSLKWEKHPPLSGDGGYFTTFEMKPNKDDEETKVKPRTRIRNKYGLSLAIFTLGLIIIVISLFTKEGELTNKYIWFVGALLYGALSPLAKGEGMKSVKSRWNIFCYNFILDSPLWLGAIMTMSAFYKAKVFGDDIWMNIGAGLIVFFGLAGRLWLNYTVEVEKYYKGNLPSLK
ncbi:hypothetical protein PDQ69_24310 [Bacillus cereus group sp. Bc062]|nr:MULTISPECIES: hypothetical protein [Bacillus cereus group]MCU5211690.1 hypothetical protein [Bacillus paranthracis]MDA2146855.1 hypothetical protein [Bacillus cereus group sp. Bc248]MDA2174730.1 hypothetical protein [Bacillus cereus group sp. Bc247]MDA2588238.1 hypothetical protein [Bacillus cereus group sp. Bc062]MDA2593668.1 hypothetical protein [Bacillus cereus group sp. Bc065]